MFQVSSGTQAPEDIQGSDDGDAELAKAVDFATLISMSSLSAPDVQDDRLTGRKEIAARLAEQAKALGVKAPCDNSATGAGSLDSVFERRVADQLEFCGHTFEAELRYRRLPGCPAVAKRLALMLDAKGFQQESWQWYLRAARSNDITSLFRLATICWQRGDRGWAMRLAKHAVAQLAPGSYRILVRNIDGLVRQRSAVLKLGNHMPVKYVLSPKMGADAVYALGSVLLVLASRPDLARLVYCSALARRHSLSAVSLLDLTRWPMVKQSGGWRLGNSLRDELGDIEFERYSLVEDQRDDFDRSLLLLRNSVQNETFEGLVKAIHMPTARREDAIERVVFTARLVTNFRGYGQFGYDIKALRYIDVAADIVCAKVHHEVVTGKVGDAASLINLIRDLSMQELSNYRLLERRHPGSCHGNDKAEEHWKKVVKSGIIGRLGREYVDLSPEHKEVLILHLAGLYSDEVAEALGYRKLDTGRMFVDAVMQLQEAQRGEQISTGKLLGAEVDSCFSGDVLEFIASLPEWNDTVPTLRSRLSLSPRHGKNCSACDKNEYRWN